jgi:sulfatase maturation enzyme AslB (radical SAM superfamily)
MHVFSSLNLIEYLHETHHYSKEYLSTANFSNIFNTNLTNIEPSTFDALRNLQINQDITITDRQNHGMGYTTNKMVH